MQVNTIHKLNCLDYLKSLPDNSLDLIFTDPPYALGSELIIRSDGKMDYKKPKDFMGVWEQPDGYFWEEWFIEAFRVLKFGGRILMFGIDRQTVLYKYYACLGGFFESQSLYWTFIQNFPKASDLSQNIDKHFGLEREVIGDKIYADGKLASKRLSKTRGYQGNAYGVFDNDLDKTTKITTPTHDLAKKYKDYKYSIAPLKQMQETIMVFQKPYKMGSCMHDTLKMESGDDTITCGAVNVGGNRVNIDNAEFLRMKAKEHKNSFDIQKSSVNFLQKRDYETNPEGRYPPNHFVDEFVADQMDKQSGVKKGGNGKPKLNHGENGKNIKFTTHKKGSFTSSYSDTAGMSKAFQVIRYDADDFDVLNFAGKTSQSERNEGTESDGNHHPTVKPQTLLRKILNYFKTPNKQIVLDCFAGSGSIPLACIAEGMDYIGVELNPEYFEIMKARLNHTHKKPNLF